ncbi:Ubiquitin-protein ligase E3B [Halocaridina rubra]|uniref:HECT-type E3 ubiquitin transferase n=1 Tax=Halocaridina rubra TaxID=373956 RepID=A0AAN9A3P5_HALRR
MEKSRAVRLGSFGNINNNSILAKLQSGHQPALLSYQKRLDDFIKALYRLRARIVEDGYRQLASLTPQALKGLIRVRFINEQGLDEAGIDQDGLWQLG